MTGAAAIPLATSPQLRLPDLQVPLIGDRWTVGAFFLIHVLFGSFTMGTLVLGPTFELIGWREGRLVRLARTLADVNIKIFSVGATLAGFAVIFLTALYPTDVAILGETFFFPLLGAFLIWVPAVAALYLYSHRWEPMRSRSIGRHVGLGYFAAALDHVFLVLIVGVDSFMLTPGTGHGLGAFFNPTFFEELAHRFVGNISWSSFLIAGVSGVLAATAASPGTRELAGWTVRLGIAIGLLTLVLQSGLGFLYAEAIRRGAPAAFHASFTGANGELWIVQVGLFSFLLLAANAYLWLGRGGRAGLYLTLAVLALSVPACLPAQAYPHGLFWLRYPIMGGQLALTLLHWLSGLGAPKPEVPSPQGRFALLAAAAAAVALFGVMGVIRTDARGDYAIYGQLTQGQAQKIYDPGREHYP